MMIPNINEIINSPVFRGPIQDGFKSLVNKLLQEFPHLTREMAETLARMIIR